MTDDEIYDLVCNLAIYYNMITDKESLISKFKELTKNKLILDTTCSKLQQINNGNNYALPNNWF